jgi:hypothetical protein
VAFAGSTDSLTLYGWEQAHRVRYLHIDVADDSRFHDRVRAFKPWRAELRGDLLGHGYYRARPLYSAWKANLERWGADVVVCHQLPAWVLRKQLFVKTPEGYPLEARWAQAHPESFEKVYDDGEVCIFEHLDRRRGDSSALSLEHELSHPSLRSATPSAKRLVRGLRVEWGPPVPTAPERRDAPAGR